MPRRFATVAALIVASLLAPLRASAAPIPFHDGLLDGVLRTYMPGGGQLVVEHDYILGTDFFPAVPLSFLNTATPYSRCPTSPALSDCLVFVLQVVTSDGSPDTPGHDLSDGCSGLTQGFQTVPIMVERGNCTFSDKWALAESRLWGGVLVANDAPGPVTEVGILPDPNFEPTIPFMRITQAVGDEIRADRLQPSFFL